MSATTDNTVIAQQGSSATISNLPEEEKQKLIRIVHELVSVKQINSTILQEKNLIEQNLKQEINKSSKLQEDLLKKCNEVNDLNEKLMRINTNQSSPVSRQITMSPHSSQALTNTLALYQQKLTSASEKNSVYESQIQTLKATIKSMESDVSRFTDLITNQQQTIKSLESKNIMIQSDLSAEVEMLKNKVIELTSLTQHNDQSDQQSIRLVEQSRLQSRLENESQLSNQIIRKFEAQIEDLKSQLAAQHYSEKKTKKIEQLNSSLLFELELIKNDAVGLRAQLEEFQKLSASRTERAIQTDGVTSNTLEPPDSLVNSVSSEPASPVSAAATNSSIYSKPKVIHDLITHKRAGYLQPTQSFVYSTHSGHNGRSTSLSTSRHNGTINVIAAHKGNISQHISGTNRLQSTYRHRSDNALLESTDSSRRSIDSTVQLDPVISQMLPRSRLEMQIGQQGLYDNSLFDLLDEIDG